MSSINNKGIKIAVSGKGGVGKTTISVLLAYNFVNKGKKVFLIDSDPDENTGLSLGLTPDEISKITPIIELKNIIEERTESKLNSGLFKLNPKVDDIPDKFSYEKNGVKLLVMGTVKQAGGGCMCPENTFLKTLLQHLIITRDEIVILDMVAGIEHLGRGTAMGVNCFLIIVEPTLKSLITSNKIKELIEQINIKKYFFIANKIHNKSDIDFLKNNIDENKILSFIPFISELTELEKGSKSLIISDIYSFFTPYINEIISKLTYF